MLLALPKLVSLVVYNLGIEQHDFGIPSFQCYKRSSTFGSRYDSIFQILVQEAIVVVGFITLQ
jgi:hypothetical protein